MRLIGSFVLETTPRSETGDELYADAIYVSVGNRTDSTLSSPTLPRGRSAVYHVKESG
jgi:hypothetical protein